MAFKITLSDYYRAFALGTTLHLIFLGYTLITLFEGIALVLTILELALLGVFIRHSVSQDSTYAFEIMGLVTSSLTVLLLPVLFVISKHPEKR